MGGNMVFFRCDIGPKLVRIMPDGYVQFPDGTRIECLDKGPAELPVLTLEEYDPNVDYPHGTVLPIGWGEKFDREYRGDHVQIQGGAS